MPRSTAVVAGAAVAQEACLSILRVAVVLVMQLDCPRWSARWRVDLLAVVARKRWSPRAEAVTRPVWSPR
ncbi:hypothetical protein [Streptomyces sp. NPDC004721]